MNQADATWRPFGEPLSATLKRTVGLALIVGVVVAGVRQKPGSFAPIVVLALWFTFGGHWVELLFLNGLRPRIPRSPVIQVIARLLTWFLGGTFLTLGMEATAQLIGESSMRLPASWIGGLGFVGVELLLHAFFRFRGMPGFFSQNG